ncbi:hypothetical protein [Epilithonimonas sp. UC225_85]|uniref:hypothetical protein n=1 Tax=Epilithonimonas sp. UC225_85 TaxID=3350167 RepID=UPI0036D2466F
MKKFSIFLSIIFIVLIKSQNLSDYKYVLIPSEFNDFKENRSYDLNVILEKSLKGKKYTILSENKTQWPSDALVNPCKVVNAEILDDKSMFRNKVILQFKDCNNQVILIQKGVSTIKEYEPGFQDALKRALVQIPVSNPSTVTEKLTDAKSQESNKSSERTPTTEVVSQTQTAQKYTRGNLTLQKVQIDESQFILVDGKSSFPFATFKSTTQNGVFRVKLGSGESTIGYYENGNIVIEMPKSNGEFSKDIFTAN